ncbi:dephospho-CoA kinase [Leptolyngbya ohadii]|uniref:dephospho-CoA kinase n=1 Tax=Leptolyngbya ohadii TaxID=1962290 RepID=UPI0015C670FD|nr:dephospho-CoA kinase [Leptolyngbya ohadii]
MSDLTQPSGQLLPHSSSLSQRIIGITGGVGMGKTTVSDYLAQTYRIPVLDADLYAREAVEPGARVLDEIVERYGKNILQSDGRLDRRRLGDIVFSSSAERLWLEQQIHPFVRDRMQADLLALPPETFPIVVLVIPLLFEARMTDLVTEIWVVRSSPEQQQQRLQQRDQLDLSQVQARINSQMAIERKMQQADLVLDNSGTLEDLYCQIDAQIGQRPAID